MGDNDKLFDCDEQIVKFLIKRSDFISTVPP